MLALSMAVTMLTQFLTTVVNSRGRHLKRGLVDLLGQLDPKLQKVAGEVATAVLTHPLVSNTFGGLGSVVHREEFTKLLLHLADTDSRALTADTKQILLQALQDNGIKDPAATLNNVRAVALQLEATNPQLGSDARQALALLEAGRSDLVGKVHNWFDQTMDRVAMRFTATTRAVTFGAAVLVAVGLQVDTVGLVNRLSADDVLRAAFVQQAVSLKSAAPTVPTVDDAERQRQYLAFLAEKGLISLPPFSYEGWTTHLGRINLFGVLITSLLLSLGAPFWYNALGRLLQLRSMIAAKDDAQRLERQTTTEGPKQVAVAVA
jgi:hypothetical protein